MNKYNGNGDLKMKVLLGLVEVDGHYKLEYDKDTDIAELIRFYGILSVEVPFLFQHLKVKKSKQGIVTPDKSIVTAN